MKIVYIMMAPRKFQLVLAGMIFWAALLPAPCGLCLDEEGSASFKETASCPVTASPPLIRRKSIAVGRDHFGQGALEFYPGVVMLHLHGAPSEIGYEHGAMLKSEIAEKIIRLEKSRKADAGQRLSPAAEKLYFMARYWPALPAWARRELKGMSRGSGVPVIDLVWLNVIAGEAGASVSQGLGAESMPDWMVVIIHGADGSWLSGIGRPGLITLSAGMDNEGCCLTTGGVGGPELKIWAREKLRAGECGRSIGAGRSACRLESRTGMPLLILDGEAALICVSTDKGESFGAVDLETEAWSDDCAACTQSAQK